MHHPSGSAAPAPCGPCEAPSSPEGCSLWGLLPVPPPPPHTRCAPPHTRPPLCSKWTEDGGGYDQYSEALPNPGLTVQLSSAGPPVAFKPRAVVLVADASGAAGTYMDLHHTNSRLKYYNETLFFTGVLPLFDLSTGVTSLSPGAERDASVTITPMVQQGEELAPDPVAVKVYSCSEFAARVPCSYLASPPPPVTVTPTPPAGAMPPTAATGSSPGGGRRRRMMAAASPTLFVPGDDATAGYMWTAAPGVTVPSAVASAAAAVSTVPTAAAVTALPVATPAAPTDAASSPATAPAPAPAAGAGWSQFSSYGAASSPSRSDGDMCDAYFRQVKFLSSVTLLAQLSGTNSSFVLTQAPGCLGAQYTTATLPVSKQTYEQDQYVGAPGAVTSAANAAAFVPMRWCSQWPQHFGPPKAQPVLTVRGAGDPWVVAEQVTQCTGAFVAGNPGASGSRGSSDREHASLMALGALLLMCGVAMGVALSRGTAKPKVNYSPLLRDVAPPPAGGSGMTSLSGYGTVTAASMPMGGGNSGAAARSGDVEFTAFARTGARKAGDDTMSAL